MQWGAVSQEYAAYTDYVRNDLSYDTGDSLRFMKIKCLKPLMPIREYSANADVKVRKNENASLKTIWEEEIKSHVGRRRDLEKGLRQAYLCWRNDLLLLSRQSYVCSPWDLFRMELVISS